MQTQDRRVGLVVEQLDDGVDNLVWGLEPRCDVVPDVIVHRIEDGWEVTGGHEVISFPQVDARPMS